MNSLKLLGIMKEHNDTQETLANAIGLSRKTLAAKIYEKKDAAFNRTEMKAIAKRYHLDKDLFNAIFFDDCVA